MSTIFLLPSPDLVLRLETRAQIRRNAITRKSVQDGAPDRIADLLEEAAAELRRVNAILEKLNHAA